MKVEIKIEIPASIFFWWEKKFRIRNWIIDILNQIYLVLPLPVIPYKMKYEENLDEGEEEYEEDIMEKLGWPIK